MAMTGTLRTRKRLFGFFVVVVFQEMEKVDQFEVCIFQMYTPSSRLPIMPRSLGRPEDGCMLNMAELPANVFPAMIFFSNGGK